MLHVYRTPGCENSMKFIFECSRSLFSHFRATMYYSVCHIAGHNMSIISIVNKIRSLSIEFDTNQSTNIRSR